MASLTVFRNRSIFETVSYIEVTFVPDFTVCLLIEKCTLGFTEQTYFRNLYQMFALQTSTSVEENNCLNGKNLFKIIF